MPCLDLSPWGLRQSPFSSYRLTRLFFEGATQREALARLRFLRTAQRFGVLEGEAGMGKSLVLKVFHQQCRQRGLAAALVHVDGLSPRELYTELARQMGATVRDGDDLPRLFRLTSDIIGTNKLLGVETVVLLDDIHEAGPDLLTQLARLMRFDARGTLTIIAATRCSQRLNESLRDRVDLRIDLEPWDELDTVGYVQLALLEAGCERPLFEDESLSEIHRLTGGVPRKVSRLAEHALLLGAVAAPDVISAQTVRTADAELTLARA